MSAGLLLNGNPVLEAVFSLPRIGGWTIDLSLHSETDISGAATVATPDGAISWVGTVVSTERFQDTVKVRILAGAGGITKTAKARHYNRSMGAVLQDLLGQSGDKLDGTSKVPSRSLTAWTVSAQAIGASFRLLLEIEGGVSWRFLPTGKLWVGAEAWPNSALKAGEYGVLERDGESGIVRYKLDAPNLLPGTTLDGDRIAHVEIKMGPEGFMGTATLEGHDINEALRKMVLGCIPQLDYHATFFAKVNSQTADGRRVDVTPEDTAIGPMKNVPLWGEAGVVVFVARNARVLVGWSAGDPSQPYAMAFDGSESVSKASWVANRINLTSESAANPAAKGNELVGLLRELISEIQVITVAVPGVVVGPGSTVSAIPNNAARFAAIAARLQTIASQKVFLE